MLVAGCILASALAAQTPDRRAHHALVYDEARALVLLTGGSTPHDGGQRFQFFNDLWAFDGSGWRRLGSSGAEISGVALAWDRHHHRILSYGGYREGSVGDLRLLEHDQWWPLGSHVAASEPGFVYDTRRDRFVAFGGSTGPGQALGDTWEYDGTAWSRRGVAGPPARMAHAMVYDAGRGRTVVFGGGAPAPRGQRPPALGDTWEFDGHQWQKHDGAGPSPRSSPGVAYDSKRGRVILFGGVGEQGFLGDTWAWDGLAWRQLADTGPEARAMGYLAYDAKRDRVVLFGGRRGWPDGDLNDTWEWDGAAWRRVGS